LRKYLIAAVAALAVIAVGTAAAVAQIPGATMQVAIQPKKAGTKKKPKNSSIKLTITNSDSKKTASRITIATPKTFRLSAKGLTKCSEAALATGGPQACPKASRVGKGEAHALLGITGTAQSPLTFKVTAIVLGAKQIGFYLEAAGLPVKPLARGTIKGQKLVINIPLEAQQPVPGVWAGLMDLHTTLKGKKGKHYLASTTGCKNKKHKFNAKVEFANNTGAGAPAPVTTKASSSCTK
jgi:hypothetical protein